MSSEAQAVATVVGVILLILVGIPVGSIYLNQCVFGCGDSLHFRVGSIGLLTHPTDNVLFGWEWLFGKPSDEITIVISSGMCSARSRHWRKIKEGEVTYPDVEINTYFHYGITFRLEEKDGGLEGKDDYSEYVNVPEEKMASMREAFDNGLAEYINLDYLVTVKGRNFFQENRWFGFLAENLCIGTMDFITGPWASKLFKLGKTLLLKASDIAKLYKTVKLQYKSGLITKKSIFKSLIIFQIKEGLKDGFIKPLKSHVFNYIKDLALNQTHLDEQIMAIVNENSLEYGGLNLEIDTRAGFLGGLTDKLEFCLSDILPPSRDALYHVNFAVTREMWYPVFTAVSFLAIFQYLMKLRALLDWDKSPSVYDHAPGPCVEVMKDGGAEDLTYLDDGGYGYILFSHGITWPRGELMIVDLSMNPLTYRVLNITNPPDRSGFMAKPHGISTWADPNTGSRTVFVITHPDSGERIEVFDLIRYSTLKHIKTITDHKFINLNNLVAIDKDKLYITQWSHYKEWWGNFIEVALMRGSGEVLYYDGKRSRSVATGFMFTNGINISPDKSTIYVADFGNKRLVGFKRLPGNGLAQQWEVDMNTCVDNIEVDQQTGDLWIGCHPMLYRILDELREKGQILPSNVLQVKIKDNMVSDVIEVYSDRDGSEMFGVGAATLVRDKLIIGAVWDQLIVCDVKHIQ